MANLSAYLQEGESIDHTPASAVAAGSLIQLAGKGVAFSPRRIAASALGAVAVTGVLRCPATATVGNVGENVWWDNNGTPAVTGGTTDGAATTNAAAGDFWIGTLVKALAATDGVADVALNRENPNLPAFIGKTHIATAVDLTLTAADHSGAVIHVTADAKTITLPTGVVGMEFIIVNDVADAGALVTVDLDGNEIIAGANLTIAATKTANLTKDTSIRGDFLHLVCNVAATSWRCVNKRGIWVTS